MWLRLHQQIRLNGSHKCGGHFDRLNAGICRPVAWNSPLLRQEKAQN